jgi:urea carboxylase-associated protein 2
VLRLVDQEGDACVQLLAYVERRPWERLNVVDTVKVQWQAYLGPGAVLLSDMGRVLLSIVADTSARHDCLCGGSSPRRNESRYGSSALGTPAVSSRQLLHLAAAKHGLGPVDLGPPVNLFKGAPVAGDGAISFDGEPRPGRFVDLRAELDVLVLLAVTPHPLDDRAVPSGTPVRATAWHTRPRTDDPLRSSTPERHRAFSNTDDLLLQGGP